MLSQHKHPAELLAPRPRTQTSFLTALRSKRVVVRRSLSSLATKPRPKGCLCDAEPRWQEARGAADLFGQWTSAVHPDKADSRINTAEKTSHGTALIQMGRPFTCQQIPFVRRTGGCASLVRGDSRRSRSSGAATWFETDSNDKIAARMSLARRGQECASAVHRRMSARMPHGRPLPTGTKRVTWNHWRVSSPLAFPTATRGRAPTFPSSRSTCRGLVDRPH